MQVADLSGLSNPPPFPLQGPLPEQIGQDQQTVEAGQVLRGIVLFEIALHRELRGSFRPGHGADGGSVSGRHP